MASTVVTNTALTMKHPSLVERPSTGYAQDSGPILVIPGTRISARTRRQGPTGRRAWSLRARLVALLLVTGVLLGINALLGGMPADAAALSAQPGEVVVIVQPGDTLWKLAQQAAPQLDPRVAILEIRALNGLADSGIMTGQRLVIPDFQARP